MPLIEIPDEWYGQSTARMQSILSQVNSIRWFDPILAGHNEHRFGSLVERFVASLDVGLRQQPTPVKADLLEGNFALLHQGKWGIDPYQPWGDRWDGGNIYEFHLMESVSHSISSNIQARSYLRPPLWPVANRSGICGQSLVADPDVLKNVPNLKPNSRDSCVAWGLLCTAEARVWNALLWELAAGFDAVACSNPFQPLLDLYELGAFPIGFADDCYELFLLKRTSQEITDPAGFPSR